MTAATTPKPSPTLAALRNALLSTTSPAALHAGGLNVARDPVSASPAVSAKAA